MKKNILILNYEYPPIGGGGGVATKELAKGFVSLGFQVDVVTSSYAGLNEREREGDINIYRVKVPFKRGKFTTSLASLIAFPFVAYPVVKKLCNKYNYLFINTHFAVPTGPLGVVVSKKFLIPNILSLHGGDIYDPTKIISPHRCFIFRRVVESVINNSYAVVAQSTNTKDNAYKYYNLRSLIKVIPLPYSLKQHKRVSRKLLNLRNNTLYVVSIGRLVKRKGYEDLVRAMSLLETGYDVQAIIIGEGPEKEKLQNLTTKLGLKNKVLILGELSEEKKHQYLANSDIYVLSSIHEGFGIVLQEAMQAELPLIVTNNGGQLDIVKHNINGLIIPTNNPRQMARAINKLIKNKALRNKLGKANKDLIYSYDPKYIAQKYLNLATGDNHEII